MSDKIKRKLILLMLTSGLAVSSLVTFSMNTFAENPGEHSNVASPSVISIQGDSKRCMKSRKTDELKVNLQEGAELVGFFSADPNVAAVNENTGEVTAVGAGETKIKAIAKKNGEEYTANCDIIVTGLVAVGGTPQNSDIPVNLSGYSYDDGDCYTSGNCLYSRNALIRWARYAPNVRKRSDDDITSHIIQKFESSALTQAALCSETVAELKKKSMPAVTFEAEVLYLPEGTGRPRMTSRGPRWSAK